MNLHGDMPFIDATKHTLDISTSAILNSVYDEKTPKLKLSLTELALPEGTNSRVG